MCTIVYALDVLLTENLLTCYDGLEVSVMIKISRITTQKKNIHRYNVFLDNGHGEKYGFSVDESVLIEENIRKGMELDNATIDRLVQKDTLHKSYTRAIHYLSYRMRTEKEIYDYLVKKETEPEHIPEIMKKLQAEGLINDAQFAAAFTDTRIHMSDKGPLLVQKELIEKGIANTIAREAVLQYTYAIQYEKAFKWAKKKLRQTKKNAFQKQLQQIQATLMQKGFTNDVIKDVREAVREEENDLEAEWEAISHHGDKLLRRHQRKYSGYELHNKVKEGLFRQGFSFDLIKRYIDDQVKDDM
jgi:regulatory protein